MSNGDAMERLRENLRALMQRKGVKPTTLSTRVRKSNPTLVADLLSKTGDVKLSTLESLSQQLGVPVEQLLLRDLGGAAVGPSLHVKGTVSAGTWVDAYEAPRDDWRVLTGRPDISAPVSDRFFLEVRGDSMDRVYPAGTFIECVNVYEFADPIPGKRVVVVRQRTDGMVEATVKEYAEIDGEAWFIPRSTNPSHAAFRASDRTDDIEDVRIAAIVVGSVRPE